MNKDYPQEIGISQAAMDFYDRDPALLKIVLAVGRPGGLLFMRKLELTMYRPGTLANDLCEVLIVAFEGIQFVVSVVPMADKPRIEQLAAGIGLRLADGVPHVIHGEQVNRFPLSSASVFVLENSKDSIVYNGPAAGQSAVDAADKALLEIEREHAAWFAAQKRHWMNGTWWDLIDSPSCGGERQLTRTRDGRLWAAEDNFERRAAKRPADYATLPEARRAQIDRQLGLLPEQAMA